MQGCDRRESGDRCESKGSRVREGWTMRLLRLALATGLAATGCASDDGPDTSDENVARISGAAIVADAPDWVAHGCRAHWRSSPERAGVVCGVGSAPPGRNPIAARETAVARARSAIARSISVTIENLVRLEDGGAAGDDGELESIIHQLTSASLPACRVESVWRSPTGEVHALVSLRVDRVQDSVRSSRALSPAAREALAQRAADAFAASRASIGADDLEPTTPVPDAE
jgi:hypothetical protein